MSNSLPLTIASAAAPANSPMGIITGILPFILIFAIFYVLMIRPQQKRMKEHRSKVEAVKKGDEVVTGGGVRGKVTRVDEQDIEVEIASGVRVRVVKGTLSDVLSRSAKPAND